jgi:hypothetical protein
MHCAAVTHSQPYCNMVCTQYPPAQQARPKCYRHKCCRHKCCRSSRVEGSRFKALYAEFTREDLDLKGHGKLANLLARCEAAGACWLEFRQEDPRHPPVLFVHGHGSSSVRGAGQVASGSGGASPASSRGVMGAVVTSTQTSTQSDKPHHSRIGGASPRCECSKIGEATALERSPTRE